MTVFLVNHEDFISEIGKMQIARVDHELNGAGGTEGLLIRAARAEKLRAPFWIYFYFPHSFLRLKGESSKWLPMKSLGSE